MPLPRSKFANCGHHGLVFGLACTVNCRTSYTQACVFQNPVQSVEFTPGRLAHVLKIIKVKKDAFELSFMLKLHL